MARWSGVLGASVFQQARGVHFQPRQQPVRQCLICGRVGTRLFQLADITLHDGSQHNGVVACSNREACFKRTDRGQVGPLFTDHAED